MKKYIVFLLLFFTLLCVPITAQAASTSYPSDPVMLEDSRIISYHALVDQTSAARQASIGAGLNLAAFKGYLVNDPAIAGLVTPQEIAMMKKFSGHTPEVITYEQAVSDVNLLFRTLHACYGLYYYFGEANYQNAESQVMAWLQGQPAVSVSELTHELRRSLIFMRDAHSAIGYQLDVLPGIRYEYYSCQNQVFSLDELGYYKVSNGEILRFAGFEDTNVSMKPTLLATDEIVYSPVLFCPDASKKNSLLFLTGPAGDIRSELLVWGSTSPYGRTPEPDYHAILQNGIGYVSMRQFRDDELPDIYAAFSASGSTMRNAKVVIFDLRSNSGGSGASVYNWIRNYTGRTPSLTESNAYRHSLLNSSRNPSTYELAYSKAGEFIPNNIPVIVLVDDLCVSAGERTIRLLRTMDNVLVVGSNSGGLLTSGNTHSIHLPNSSIPCKIPTMIFQDANEGKEYIGLEPDVWCNPISALDYALNMINRYQLADAASVEAMRTTLHANIVTTNLSLLWDGYMASPNSGFGCNNGVHTITVYRNGEPTTDFAVSSSNPNVCVCERTADGLIRLTVTGLGDSMLTVTSGNTTNTFRWHSE